MTYADDVKEEPDAARVWRLMEEISICMLTTHDGGGMRARPMEARPRESEHAIYFLTGADSHKTEEIGEDGSVCLAFAEPGDGKFLSVTGKARLLDDRPLIQALWKPEAKAFWDGPDDPDLRAVEVTPEEAQFWDSPGKLAATIALVAAGVAGKTPDLGESRTVDLH